MEKLKEGTHYECIPHTAVLDSRLTDKSLRLLLVLWVETNSNSGSCHYSTDTLMKLCGFKSKETLANAQKELVSAGWLEVKRGGVYGGRKQTNTYTILPNNVVSTECMRDNFIEKKPKEEKSEVTTSDTSPKQESHKTLKKQEKKSTPTTYDPKLLKRMFTLNGVYLPEDSDMAYMWKDTLEAFKAELESGKYTLTEETYEECKRHVYQMRHKYM